MRTALYLTFVLLTVAVFAGGMLSADEEGLRHERFDVSVLVRPHEHQRGAKLAAGAPLERDDRKAGKPPEPQEYVSGDMLVELIRSSIDASSWDSVEGASIEFRGHWLQVRHRPETVQKVAQLVYQLTLEAQRRLLLSIEVVEGASTGFPAPPESARVVSSGSLSLPFGIERILTRTSRVRYVADYEVEIAQGSNISNPIVVGVDEGLLASFVATPSIDGEKVVLEGLVQTAAYDKSARLLSLGMDEELMAEPYRSEVRSTYGILELPRYEHMQMHFTTVVPASGSTFSLPVAVRGRMVELRLKTRMPSPRGAVPVIDLGALVREPMPVVFGKQVDTVPLHWFAPRVRYVPGSEPRPCYAHSEEVLDEIRSRVSPSFWEERGAIELMGAQRIYVQADERRLAEVRSFLQDLERQAVRSIVVDIHVWSMPAPVETGLVKTFSRDGGRLVAAGTLPTVMGRTASLMAGSTANFIADYDVEVAQEARIADPNVGQSFDGLVVNVRPALAVDKRTVSLSVQMLLARRTFAKRTFETGAKFLGPIDHVRQDRSVVDTRVQIPAGGTYIIDMGVDPEQKDRRLFAEIGVKLP